MKHFKTSVGAAICSAGLVAMLLNLAEWYAG